MPTKSVVFGVSRMETRKLLTRTEAAEYLGVKPQTLSAWQSRGRYGLRMVKVGRIVRYRLTDLDAWLEARTVSGRANARRRGRA